LARILLIFLNGSGWNSPLTRGRTLDPATCVSGHRPYGFPFVLAPPCPQDQCRSAVNKAVAGFTLSDGTSLLSDGLDAFSVWPRSSYFSFAEQDSALTLGGQAGARSFPSRFNEEEAFSAA